MQNNKFHVVKIDLNGEQIDVKLDEFNLIDKSQNFDYCIQEDYYIKTSIKPRQ